MKTFDVYFYNVFQEKIGNADSLDAAKSIAEQDAEEHLNWNSEKAPFGIQHNGVGSADYSYRIYEKEIEPSPAAYIPTQTEIDRMDYAMKHLDD